MKYRLTKNLLAEVADFTNSQVSCLIRVDFKPLSDYVLVLLKYIYIINILLWASKIISITAMA
jgi:hypothetical protein